MFYLSQAKNFVFILKKKVIQQQRNYLIQFALLWGKTWLIFVTVHAKFIWV